MTTTEQTPPSTNGHWTTIAHPRTETASSNPSPTEIGEDTSAFSQAPSQSLRLDPHKLKLYTGHLIEEVRQGIEELWFIKQDAQDTVCAVDHALREFAVTLQKPRL